MDKEQLWQDMHEEYSDLVGAWGDELNTLADGRATLIRGARHLPSPRYVSAKP